MVRISDILRRRGGQSPEPEPEKKPQKEIPRPEQEISRPQQETSKPAQQEEQGRPEEMQIAKAMKEIQPDKAHSRNLYLAGIKLSEEVSKNIKEAKPIDLNQVKSWLSEIVDYLVLKDRELPSLFYEDTADNYLNAKMVNVPIMAIEVGLGMGYNKSKLNELALAGFLHDIGMLKVESLALLPRKLSEEEYNKIKEHPLYGAEILSKIKDIPEPVIYAAKERHEQVNGKGYPFGIKDGDISEYARIIAVIDTYEALTHKRPYHDRVPAYEAIKEMLTSDGLIFDLAILRILVNRVGLYPFGSWVELNSQEIGKVIAPNDELPMRPVVSIIFDSTKKQLKEPRLINLAKQFNLYIKKPLSDKEVLELAK